MCTYRGDKTHRPSQTVAGEGNEHPLLFGEVTIHREISRRHIRSLPNIPIGDTRLYDWLYVERKEREIHQEYALLSTIISTPSWYCLHWWQCFYRPERLLVLAYTWPKAYETFDWEDNFFLIVKRQMIRFWLSLRSSVDMLNLCKFYPKVFGVCNLFIWQEKHAD